MSKQPLVFYQLQIDNAGTYSRFLKGQDRIAYFDNAKKSSLILRILQDFKIDLGALLIENMEKTGADKMLIDLLRRVKLG